MYLILYNRDVFVNRTEEYKDFCKATKVKEKTERLRYECSKENLRRSKAWREIEKGQKGFAKAEGNDTLNTAKEEKGIEVHTIGRIDKNIYKCVTEDIVTDEVVITDNQIQHIKDRHPGDYERFSKYFREIVTSPDYIIESKKPNTAIILKEIVDEGDKFQTVLRLCTSEDPNGYKNSIITFLKIDEKRWERYLRTKEILYKKN